jgi:hypothetical protein
VGKSVIASLAIDLPGVTPKLRMFNKYESRPYLGRDIF